MGLCYSITHPRVSIFIAGHAGHQIGAKNTVVSVQLKYKPCGVETKAEDTLSQPSSEIVKLQEQLPKGQNPSMSPETSLFLSNC